MTDETNTAPAVPPLPANYFSDSKARADHWQATVKNFETASTAQPAAPQPNAQDLERLDLTAQHVVGGKAVILNPEGMRVIEKLRADVLSGKALDVAAAKIELSKALGLPVPEAPADDAPPAASDQPVSDVLDPAALTVEQRAGYEILPGVELTQADLVELADARSAGVSQAELDSWLAVRGTIEVADGDARFIDEIPPRDLCGYQINLPDGWGLSPADLADLQAARRAGISQSRVNAFIRARIARESGE